MCASGTGLLRILFQGAFWLTLLFLTYDLRPHAAHAVDPESARQTEPLQPDASRAFDSAPDSLDWIFAWANAGQRARSDSFELVYTLGQPIGICGVSNTIFSTDPLYHQLGGGFWHLAPGVDACSIVSVGDNNCTGVTTSADIINLVNFVFKGACSLCPWSYAGDTNCNGTVNSADIILLVNYVFKSGPEPCDACTSPAFYVALCRCGN